eukprot:15460653-Alexandrium_andersonii.AAC.1
MNPRASKEGSAPREHVGSRNELRIVAVSDHDNTADQTILANSPSKVSGTSFLPTRWPGWG